MQQLFRRNFIQDFWESQVPRYRPTDGGKIIRMPSNCLKKRFNATVVVDSVVLAPGGI